MRIEVDPSHDDISIVLKGRCDVVHIGLAEQDWWLPATVGIHDFGDKRALKVDFDLKDLYRGSDGAFYIIHALGADEAAFGDLKLTRIAKPRCEEDL